MPNAPRRLTRSFAVLTAVLYFSTTILPAGLLAAAPADKAVKKSSSKSKTPKTENTIPRDATIYPPVLIGPGDILTIIVYGEQALPVDYQVDSDGIITYPYIGNVFLGGFTPSEASAKLAKLLIKPRKVTVLIKESNTYWVSILGNVVKPGKYQIHGRPTLLSALAEAGGPLPNSDLGGTILIHRGNKLKLDLNNYFQGEGKMVTEPYLYPGDVLAVAKSGAPTLGEIAIVTSILASAAVITVELSNLRR